MHSATFRSEEPLAHLVRALDELARSGFSLCAVSVSGTISPADVRIDFAGAGSVPAQTYFARLARMSGVLDVAGEEGA